MWVELVRAKWHDPFSSLRRKQFELSLVKEFLLDGQLSQSTISKRQKTRELGAVTQPMDTERMEDFASHC